MTRVLVADDSSTVRRLVAARLEADGHEVVEAEDGVRALELARSLAYWAAWSVASGAWS